MKQRPPVSSVFGIGGNARNSQSYVDRGGLDQHLDYLLKTERHIVIHGESKQGKSWLRARAIPDEASLVIQCQPGMNIEGVFKDALGKLGIRAELKQTSQNNLEGSLEVTASAEFSASFLAKLGFDTKAAGKKASGKQTETQAIGHTPADIAWISEIFKESGRRIVLEDFHYLTESARKSFAYVMKALGEYGVFVLIVGVWPQDHLLSYYNGDLDGRVEDIHLSWTRDELDSVLKKGCQALSIGMTSSVREYVISDSYSNVGLLQRLAERLCLEEGVAKKESDEYLYITLGDSLDRARAAVATGMRNRYKSFAEQFVQGIQQAPDGANVYLCVLRAITDRSDDELAGGLVATDILKSSTAGVESKSYANQILSKIDQLQINAGVKPAVLTYVEYSRRLFVIDTAFLFFRRYGSPVWPWDDQDFEIMNDVVPSIVSETK